MLNNDRLSEYLTLNCHTDVFWLDTVGRSGLQLFSGIPEGRRLRRLRVVRSRVVGSTVHVEGTHPPGSYSSLGDAETRTVASPTLEENLTEDDFLVVDDRVAVRLVYDDHNRFVCAYAGLESLHRYRFIIDTYWPTAQRMVRATASQRLGPNR